MKAKIENGKLALTKELLACAALPENGECEVVPQPPGLAILPASTPSPGPPYPTPWDLVELLRSGKKPVSAIDYEPDPADEAD